MDLEDEFKAYQGSGMEYIFIKTTEKISKEINETTI